MYVGFSRLAVSGAISHNIRGEAQRFFRFVYTLSFFLGSDRCSCAPNTLPIFVQEVRDYIITVVSNFVVGWLGSVEAWQSQHRAIRWLVFGSAKKAQVRAEDTLRSPSCDLVSVAR